MMSVEFLRVPPFPGHRAPPLAVAAGEASAAEPGEVVAGLRRLRVGGRFWGFRHQIVPERDIVICTSRRDPGELLAAVRAAGLIDRAVLVGKAGKRGTISDACDLWHLCEHASQVFADADHEAVLIAALCRTPVSIVGRGRFADLADPDALEQVVERTLCRAMSYRDPYTQAPLSVTAAIELLGRWRRLIDANRQAAEIYGMAAWKRVTTDALLWDGTGRVRHANRASPRAAEAGETILAWVARTDPRHLDELRSRGVRIGEIEDGMIRSTGLGANCVPPLSIIVDFAGPHFDPAQPSTLEKLLQHATIGADLEARARRLRERLVREGISKYAQDSGHRPAPRPSGRRRVLATGQVEDDRSMLFGGAGVDNLELLRRTRDAEPEAEIIFKPHPDVEAGHRKGALPDETALRFADRIDRSSSIAALLDQVDAVHVVTSLAGFEALMRGREVITHGVPFYAGWGLTRDMGPVPARRSRRRTLDELVAATLLLYPRYLDPVTRLPCEAETLVDRIARGRAVVRSPLVWVRESQGRINRIAGSIGFATGARR